MEQIGYSLVDAQGTELQYWGDTSGVMVTPSRVVWPNGDITEGVSGPLDYADWKLVRRFMTYGASESGPTMTDAGVIVTKDISDLKTRLRAQVVADAESCRQRFITPGSGKAMDYLEKHNQANTIHDLGQEVATALSESDRRAQFPTLAASVGREAPTLWECAQIVIARYEAWATISYDINTAELDGKIAIRDASDAAAARAAYEAITWPSP